MLIHLRTVLNRTFLGLLLLLLMLVLRAFFVSQAAAQDSTFIIWVFDKSLRDSQFGYFDGTTSQVTEPVYAGADLEGLTCRSNVIYVSGGLDGRAPSTLNTLAVDSATQHATLTKIADIRTNNGDPFFEVVSLSTRADDTLWGYADMAPQRGIIQISPTDGVAELIVPFDHKVEGITWLGNTLWLAGNNDLYTWTPGGAIQHVFDVDGLGQIEALEAIDGLLYAGVHKDSRGVIAIDPATGAVVADKGFPAPDDIEGLTYCLLQPPILPTPTASSTVTPTPTETPTLTTTPTVAHSATATASATATPTNTPTTTASQPAATATAQVTPTATATPTGTMPATATATLLPTPTLLATATDTNTPTATPQEDLPPPTGLDPIDEPGQPVGPAIYLPVIIH